MTCKTLNTDGVKLFHLRVFFHDWKHTYIHSLAHFLLSILSTVCNCDLARSGFFQKKGEYICTADYQRLYGTRCDRCDSFITGEVVSALGRTYHPKCFVCSVCRYPGTLTKTHSTDKYCHTV